jgi:polar amino acid transport system substrate-binding protein
MERGVASHATRRRHDRRRPPRASVRRNVLGALGRVGVAFAAVAAFAITAESPVRAQDTDDLVVGAYEVDPFVVRTGDVPGGIMFDVWQQVATELGWSYEVVWVDSLDELGDAIVAGEVDVALAPLSSTSEREEQFDFSTAIVASGPAFGVHQRTENPVTLASALFSRDTVRLLVWSAIALVVLGHLMWWVDRRNPESDLSRSYPRGVWDGIWWATVTVTTVGYGDTSPKTAGGRVVAMLAMVGSLFLVGAFVSEVTTALQTGRAETVVADVGDLESRSVGVIDGSSYQAYLDERAVDTVGYTTQVEVFEAAADGELDIVLADEYTLASVGDGYGLRSSGEPLYDEFVAFGMSDGSPLRSEINGVLSDIQRQGLVRQIVSRWTD